ncbi:MAG: hypothetical protein ABIJ43_05825 [Candidatus Beckwithbacteria bacterium]|uniref:Uncharacterized protein n=1 Tax=viral metagenome TaxID=1070528 RepID=A0A6M3LEQ7_9ZZZZ
MKEFNGWIKLHNKFLEWEWINKPEMISVFIYLLLSANYQEKSWQGQIIRRGQTIIGREKLAQTLGISPQTIRTCISKLKSTSEITTKSTNKYTLISILNYDKYQSKSTSQPTTNLTNNQPATNQQLTTPKEYKNIRSKEEDISKEIVAYGNPQINQVNSFLKAKIGGSPDGSIAENRRFAKLLLDRMKKDYPDKEPVKQVCSLIDYGIEDKFHGKNITTFKYLYYNAQKIIASVRSNKGKVVIIK